MRFQLLVTHQLESRAESVLLRLFESVQNQELPVQDSLEVLCLLQECRTIPKWITAQTERGRIRILETEKRLPVSKARNLLLRSTSIRSDDLILFPDDDCWFPENSISFIANVFRRTGSDLLFVWYNDPPLTAAAYPAIEFFQPSRVQVMRRAATITMTLRGSLIEQIGSLDERIGLGTKMGGGEDTDFAYRAFKKAQKPLMTYAPILGHRTLNGNFGIRIRAMRRYWPGLMFQTIQNAEKEVYVLLGYRILVGLFLCVIGQLSPNKFLLPFKTAFRESLRIKGN